MRNSWLAGIAFGLLAVSANSGADAADKVVFGTVPIAGTAAAWGDAPLVSVEG
jgi:hypothetical protein